MSWVGRLVAREKGGTLVGNLIRRGIQAAVMRASYGLIDTNRLGLTDGHLNGGMDSVYTDVKQAVGMD